MRMKITGAILLLLALVVQGTALAVPDVIRLHIIANSDLPQDQQVKEQVRDKIIEELGPVFAEMEQEQVASWILTNDIVIEGIASQVLKEEGFSYPATVKFGVATYPTRVYGEAAYPAGKYKSLRIELGAGEGRNWWCIMFPPLCFVKEAAAAQDKGQDVRVRFWFWEKIMAIFQSEGGE